MDILTLLCINKLSSLFIKSPCKIIMANLTRGYFKQLEMEKKSYNSLYLELLFLLFSTGYFSAFFTNFLRIISLISKSKLSASI